MCQLPEEPVQTVADGGITEACSRQSHLSRPVRGTGAPSRGDSGGNRTDSRFVWADRGKETGGYWGICECGVATHAGDEGSSFAEAVQETAERRDIGMVSPMAFSVE